MARPLGQASRRGSAALAGPRRRFECRAGDHRTRRRRGDPVWSRDGRQLFFIGGQERAGNLWAVSLADRQERPVTALTGRLGHLMGNALATDGQRLFFSWEESLGDIWVMDVTGSRPE